MLRNNAKKGLALWMLDIWHWHSERRSSSSSKQQRIIGGGGGEAEKQKRRRLHGAGDTEF
jgi:hypothetical protein